MAQIYNSGKGYSNPFQIVQTDVDKISLQKGIIYDCLNQAVFKPRIGASTLKDIWSEQNHPTITVSSGSIIYFKITHSDKSLLAGLDYGATISLVEILAGSSLPEPTNTISYLEIGIINTISEKRFSFTQKISSDVFLWISKNNAVESSSPSPTTCFDFIGDFTVTANDDHCVNIVQDKKRICFQFDSEDGALFSITNKSPKTVTACLNNAL